LNEWYTFIKENQVHTAIISRYIEYLPSTYLGNVKNVYLIMHDLALPGSILIGNSKLKTIFGLSSWHSEYLKRTFPIFSNIITHFSYGIDKKFCINKDRKDRIKGRFIYSSFPNRGLLQLLEIWPKILEKHPYCTLDVFCDIDGKWVNNTVPDIMNKIKEKLPMKNVFLKGWVNKNDLADAWNKADIWLYPCTYLETFCLTALEAASSETLVITNHNAALRDTVGDRGVIIKGDPTKVDWQESALEKVFDYLENPDMYSEYIQRNKEWSEKLSWKTIANEFYNYIKQVDNKVDISVEKEIKDDVKEAINILDINSHSGLSLIDLLDKNLEAKAYAIDLWTDVNLQKLFIGNIVKKSYTNRVRFFKGTIHNSLLKLYFDKQKFDYVNINPIVNIFDLYLQILISWNMLNKNGIMNINSEQTSKIYFLQHIDKEYEIIEKNDTRMILRKI
jgi:hypothetical protein